ncbi:hypothetical protein F511_45206 [Dorcoceras hygrometricum]|uniref:CCHC-type domain-containing protein n=1 Tax=Dorcoceras hygrometricum TaxID=472368 RepID=A0A2Z6ZXU8_9LAMI|nr:hypothetical protein F511_45206 [Dorcoceras hygrometricum]
MRRSFNPSSPYNNFHKSDKAVSDMNCYNCDRPGNFSADCNRPKKEERYRRDEKEDRIRRDEKSDDRSKDDKKTVERYKERSKDRRMRARSNKKPSRKYDRKVLVAEESTKSWADTDSESSSSSSASSDSEHEEVHCLMADQTSDDELVYDKFNKMSFVKSNVKYDCYESITFDDQNSPKLNDNGKAGIGFQRPENSKPRWLKNKLEKDKAKAGSKSFVPNQPRRNSRKEKSGWTKAQLRRDLSGHYMK